MLEDILEMVLGIAEVAEAIITDKAEKKSAEDPADTDRSSLDSTLGAYAASHIISD